MGFVRGGLHFREATRARVLISASRMPVAHVVVGFPRFSFAAVRSIGGVGGDLGTWGLGV